MSHADWPGHAAYLRDLAERVYKIPCVHGTDQGDVDRLREIAAELEGPFKYATVDPVPADQLEEYRRMAEGKATCAGCGRIKNHLYSEGHAPGCPHDS